MLVEIQEGFRYSNQVTSNFFQRPDNRLEMRQITKILQVVDRKELTPTALT
ncbi:hypothetical protein BH23PLA1_BH23PLA1_25380 [soil metagenome]